MRRPRISDEMLKMLCENPDAVLQRLEQSRQAAEDHVTRKVKRIAPRAIGKEMTIRIDRHRSFTGVIVACEVGGVRYTGSKVQGLFRVTLQGATGRRETFTVKRVPT